MKLASSQRFPPGMGSLIRKMLSNFRSKSGVLRLILPFFFVDLGASANFATSLPTLPELGSGGWELCRDATGQSAWWLKPFSARTAQEESQ